MHQPVIDREVASRSSFKKRGAFYYCENERFVWLTYCEHTHTEILLFEVEEREREVEETHPPMTEER